MTMAPTPGSEEPAEVLTGKVVVTGLPLRLIPCPE